jgi:hypothetical protein
LYGFVNRLVRRLTPRFIRRRNLALIYYKPKLSLNKKWQFQKRDDSNFYYDLEEKNLSDLGSLLSIITKTSFDEVMSYLKN